MYTSKVDIMKGERFVLTSYGRGAAYVLRDIQSRCSLWVEGGDAFELRGEIEAIETQHPDWTPDQTLGWLWDQCGYGSVAKPDED